MMKHLPCLPLLVLLALSCSKDQDITGPDDTRHSIVGDWAVHQVAILTTQTQYVFYPNVSGVITFDSTRADSTGAVTFQYTIYGESNSLAGTYFLGVAPWLPIGEPFEIAWTNDAGPRWVGTLTETSLSFSHDTRKRPLPDKAYIFHCVAQD